MHVCWYVCVCVCVCVFREKTKPACSDVGGCVWANLLWLAGGHFYGPVCVCVCVCVLVCVLNRFLCLGFATDAPGTTAMFTVRTL